MSHLQWWLSVKSAWPLLDQRVVGHKLPYWCPPWLTLRLTALSAAREVRLETTSRTHTVIFSKLCIEFLPLAPVCIIKASVCHSFQPSNVSKCSFLCVIRQQMKEKATFLLFRNSNTSANIWLWLYCSEHCAALSNIWCVFKDYETF